MRRSATPGGAGCCRARENAEYVQMDIPFSCSRSPTRGVSSAKMLRTCASSRSSGLPEGTMMCGNRFATSVIVNHGSQPCRVSRPGRRGHLRPVVAEAFRACPAARSDNSRACATPTAHAAAEQHVGRPASFPTRPPRRRASSSRTYNCRNAALRSSNPGSSTTSARRAGSSHPASASGVVGVEGGPQFGVV